MREVLPDLLRWWEAGETVGVGTVVATFSSAPRPAGAHPAARADADRGRGCDADADDGRRDGLPLPDLRRQRLRARRRAGRRVLDDGRGALDARAEGGAWLASYPASLSLSGPATDSRRPPLPRPRPGCSGARARRSCR